MANHMISLITSSTTDPRHNMPNFLIHPLFILFIFFITNTVKPAFVVYKAVTCIQG
jgi:hypothetical protein